MISEWIIVSKRMYQAGQLKVEAPAPVFSPI
jgi:hypothetical protein